jgi:hypothetical protein
VAPVVWSAFILFPKLVSDLRSGFSSVLAIGCLLYLLASLARSRGKKAETRLLEAWGAFPTTIILRHREGTIDPITKERYHKALTALQGIGQLPTAAEEKADPGRADHIYRSATKRLIELRRGAKYQMLEDENASYGFRRNLFGLRLTASSISLMAAIVTAVVWWSLLVKPIDLATVENSISTYPYLPVLIVTDIVYGLLVAWFVDREFVRQAAFEYASALLRTLEEPA